MCTVTFIKSGDQVFFTSNRDVNIGRSSKVVVSEFINNSELIYPKDALAGGTWIGTSNKNRTACLLNGGFENHVSTPPYRLSRGKMVLRYFYHSDVIAFVENYDFSGIEPFTFIIYENDQLYEIRWTAQQQIHFRSLDVNTPHIWSSATLYEPTIQEKRVALFDTFLAQNDVMTQRKVIDFHRTASIQDPFNDLVMNRDGKVQTVSITNIWIKSNRTTLRFYELHSKHVASLTLNHEKQIG